jgi:hypothetical protein
MPSIKAAKSRRGIIIKRKVLADKINLLKNSPFFLEKKLIPNFIDKPIPIKTANNSNKPYGKIFHRIKKPDS